MSNLYIKVRTNFFTHRKTAKLRAMIGDAAYWLPLRLWAYAAENQPDGNMAGYADDELAMLIGCLSNAPSNACSIVQALKVVGYIDESGMIHDWDEHNGYHANFSERARNAANARWGKKSPPLPPATETGHRIGECSIAPSNACSITQASLPGVETAPTVTPEDIYAAYPKKADRPAAFRAIAKAVRKIAPARLLEQVKAYAEVVKGEDMAFIPHPATWINAERFNDGPETWLNKPNAPAAKSRCGNPRNENMNKGVVYSLDKVNASKARQAAEAAAKLATTPQQPPTTPL